MLQMLAGAFRMMQKEARGTPFKAVLLNMLHRQQVKGKDTLENCADFLQRRVENASLTYRKKHLLLNVFL